MHRVAWISIAFATAQLLAACQGGGGPTRSCNQGYACVEYEYPELDDDAWERMQVACEAGGGTWESCPAERRAGECELTGASWGGVRLVFYAGYVCSAEEGRGLCESAATSGIYTAHYRAGSATCGAPTPRTTVCDLRATDEHSCLRVSGPMAPERLAVLERSCANLGGTLATLCPATGRVATCEFTHPVWAVMGTLEYYAGADLTAASARCADVGGAWSEVLE
ncbi:MAG TPA: hypothetical protein VEB43_17615 [Anaeromyxobacter sp.]|nr:hypothetical protein [Anaeromyxobacter sp.]